MCAFHAVTEDGRRTQCVGRRTQADAGCARNALKTGGLSGTLSTCKKLKAVFVRTKALLWSGVGLRTQDAGPKVKDSGTGLGLASRVLSPK